jgi:hypothetical protein
MESALKYWNEFDSKWGFNDGQSIPEDAYEARRVYVQAVNTIANGLESSVRVVAWDRPGVHNPYLIVFFERDLLASLGDFDYARPEQWPLDVYRALEQAQEAIPDEAMQDAIQRAEEDDLDQYVIVTVSIDPSFEDYLNDLISGA